MRPAVGLVVNPAAGRDIRRLVADAPLMSHREKASMCRRVLEGLASLGVEQVWALDDGVGILGAALDGLREPLDVRMLPVELAGTAEDSVTAGRMLADLPVGAIVTLGGDGTNRAVASSCRDVPLVALSTGTNNVFPTLVDGTVAGIAAALVATEAVPLHRVARRSKRVEVETAGQLDFALVDAAVCRDRFVASRAVWDHERVGAVLLTRAEPWAVGLSAIGGMIRPLGVDEPAGLYLELGAGTVVRAAIAPGRVAEVPVRDWWLVELDEEVELPQLAGTIALDGERELSAGGPARARVTTRGPLVVDINAALAAAAVSDPGALREVGSADA